MAKTFRIDPKMRRIRPIGDALKKLGYVETREAVCDVFVIWNASKGRSKARALAARAGQTLYLEHGFIKRGPYSQLDTKGFLHGASWAHSFDNPPAFARARLLSLTTPKEVKARSSGPILILGQVDGDSQMRGSPIRRVKTLLGLISKALPKGVEAVFRRHPNKRSGKNPVDPKLFPNIRFSVAFTKDIKAYSSIKEGRSLDEELSECRFAIAINSNALVDATIAGVPCLAFGPCLGVNAGVFMAGGIATARKDIRKMLAGWYPGKQKVSNFLETLCCHQWNESELADPDVIKSVLVRG